MNLDVDAPSRAELAARVEALELELARVRAYIAGAGRALTGLSLLEDELD